MPGVQKRHLDQKRSLSSLVPVMVLLAGCLAIAAGPRASKTIVFYDPDANHQAIGSISSMVNKYLQGVHPELSFQPFQSREAFEQFLDQNHPGFALVCSAYLLSSSRERLSPFLVPTAGGSVFFHKVLVSRSKITVTDLNGVSTAVAAVDKDPGRAGQVALRRLEGSGVSTKGAIIVPVSKDIDALLALSFGQVQAALVTPGSIEVLKRINPSAVDSFNLQRETKPILRSPLCAILDFASAAEKDLVTKAILNMAKAEEGRKALALLGIEGWVPFQASMLEE